MKKLNRKIIGRVCVGIVLLALVLWLMPLPLPFHISLSGVRVEGSTAAEPPRWRPRAGGCAGSCVGRSCGRRLRWRRRRERKSTSRWIACGS